MTIADLRLEEKSRAPLLLAVGAGALASFTLVARAVSKRETARVDHKAHRKLKARDGKPARDAAEKLAPIGKWWTYVPVATAVAAFVVAAKRERRTPSRLAGAGAIVAVAALAAALNETFDDLFDQPPAPPGRDSIRHPVFPSGHAFGTATVALTAAYVLTREELLTTALAYPLALSLPVASSVARLMEEKHWLSDVLGGYLAAITLASIPLAGYEMFRAANTVSASSESSGSPA